MSAEEQLKSEAKMDRLFPKETFQILLAKVLEDLHLGSAAASGMIEIEPIPSSLLFPWGPIKHIEVPCPDHFKRIMLEERREHRLPSRQTPQNMIVFFPQPTLELKVPGVDASVAPLSLHPVIAF